MVNRQERRPRAPGKRASLGAEDTLPLGEFEDFDVFAESALPTEGRGHEEVAVAAETTSPDTSRPTIDETRERYEEHWMAIDGVQGVASGIDDRTGQPVLDVYVSQKTEAIRQQIPDEADGYPVRLVPVHGEFTTLPA